MDAYETTAGGALGTDTYLLNPMYLVSFSPTSSHVHFQDPQHLRQVRPSFFYLYWWLFGFGAAPMGRR